MTIQSHSKYLKADFVLIRQIVTKLLFPLQIFYTFNIYIYLVEQIPRFSMFFSTVNFGINNSIFFFEKTIVYFSRILFYSTRNDQNKNFVLHIPRNKLMSSFSNLDIYIYTLQNHSSKHENSKPKR